MKISKFITIGTIITIISIGYVHQRTEMIKLGYALQDNRIKLATLVDQNSKLMYNLSKLESPRTLLASLDCEQIKFANHRQRQEESYQLTGSEAQKISSTEAIFGRFLDLFTLNAEARPRK